MIYYFSGTGNSREVACQLAAATRDSMTDITSPQAVIEENLLRIGFVFPVYAWGIPVVMKKFIQQMKIIRQPDYVYMVCTCGDDIGQTDSELAQLLRAKGLTLDAAWSVTMPNTYISLPGFDIDSTEVAERKIQETFKTIPAIAEKVRQQERGIRNVTPGAFPFLKSRILRPLFLKFLSSDRLFHTTAACIKCSKCSKACPVNNITRTDDGHPQWNGQCTACLSCYHHCPENAIRYGHFSQGKGQYTLETFLKKNH